MLTLIGSIQEQQTEIRWLMAVVAAAITGLFWLPARKGQVR